MSWFESVSFKNSTSDAVKPTFDAAAMAQLGAMSPLWMLFLGASTAGMAYWGMTRWMRLATPERMVENVVKLHLVKPASAPVAEPVVAAPEPVAELEAAEPTPVAPKPVEIEVASVATVAPEPVAQAAAAVAPELVQIAPTPKPALVKAETPKPAPAAKPLAARQVAVKPVTASSVPAPAPAKAAPTMAAPVKAAAPKSAPVKAAAPKRVVKAKPKA